MNIVVADSYTAARNVIEHDWGMRMFNWVLLNNNDQLTWRGLQGRTILDTDVVVLVSEPVESLHLLMVDRGWDGLPRNPPPNVDPLVSS